MQELRNTAIEYGQRVEALLERLGARGPARGAGDLLDQVKHLLDEPGLRTIRRFLRYRNKVVHDKPPHMPMPSLAQVEQAGRAAVEVLEGLLAARVRTAVTHTPPPAAATSRPQEASGPAYRIRERNGAYEVWVGPAGVWVVAPDRQVRQRVQLDVEVRLVAHFPRLKVKAVGRARGLKHRIFRGRPGLSPEGVRAAVRLLTDSGPTAPAPRPPSAGVAPAGRIRRIRHGDIPATFYVGPAGVVVASEYHLVADTEARRLFEESGGAIGALPVALGQEGRVGALLALPDEGAVQRYLLGEQRLDEDEIEAVAAWLRNRKLTPPATREKGGRYRLKGAQVVGAVTPAPPAFIVERLTPAPPPRPSILARLSWRVLFLPEMVLLAGAALRFEPWLWALVALLALRFAALFRKEDGWRPRLLLAVGALEVAFVGYSAFIGPAALKDPGHLLMLAVFGLPGLISVFRGLWLLRWSLPWWLWTPGMSRS